MGKAKKSKENKIIFLNSTLGVEYVSANVRFGKNRSAKDGNVSFAYASFLGYRKGEDGKPEIVESEAEVIRRIYARYLQGESLKGIAKQLTDDGIRTPRGKTHWEPGTVRSILSNERYKGDAILGKTYIEDCISKKIRVNAGERPKYYVQNSHPAIIDAETFGRVQEELARRSSKMEGKKVGDKTLQRKYSGKYAMSDLLICGECGSAYRRCTWTAKEEKRVVWRCMNRLEHGKQNCRHSPTLDENSLQAAVMDAITERVRDDPKLYPCIEYACATGMSFLTTDTKGNLLRNYGMVAKNSYGYRISVIDLRNPTRSNGNNLLHLVNKYMELYKANPEQLTHKAEKYAKIIAKTVILSGMDGSSFGQNAYFYDAAEGLLTATILLVAEFCEPEKRHIVSVFKIIQELLAPAPLQKGQRVQKTQFQLLMEMLPDDHKAKWFAGAALNSSEQSMASVMSTALSRLNAFLDSELEQLLCFDTEIDAENFCKEKSAIFLILPEENPNCYFLASLFTQQLYREILSVADESGGKLKNRCVFFADEFGTMPKIESAEMMFSAARSRRLQIVRSSNPLHSLKRITAKKGRTSS